MWGGDIEPEAHWKLWDALDYESGNQIRHIKRFMSVVAGGPSNLIPNSELVTPNKSGEHLGYRGWAYCAHTHDFDVLLLYFEKDCPRASVRGLPSNSMYHLQWFDPRTGKWVDDAELGVAKSNEINRIKLPDFPSEEDWGLCLKKSC